MKIRFTNESLRLRITPAELAALLRGETVTEAFAVAGGGWVASLAPTDGESGVVASGAMVAIHLSPADRDSLADAATEGVYKATGAIRFSVEKDFPCLHPRASEAMEPTTETFAPPPGFAERKD